MNAEFKGKTALVTGGNKGIGFAICKGLINLGFDVIIAARSLAKGKEAAAQLKSPDSRIAAMQLDVTDDPSIFLAAQALTRSCHRLDVLINNAGILPDRGLNLLNISRDMLDLTMHTNAFGAVSVTQAFLPLLAKSDAGRIINVSSGYGQLNTLSASVPAAYGLSKLALNGATIMLADTLRSQGIAVYAMCPGWVRTDMGGAAATRSPGEGADTAIWLATSAGPELSGKFFVDRQEISY
ncbi:MAG: SDR family NAD(P)-dependent oxidoreductase [Hormoscilla sp. GM102CHS1]|nr:SDR family NAD(P)-dependent oxidoreductase [Hormoscilla sp. GM102CHS1]